MLVGADVQETRLFTLDIGWLDVVGEPNLVPHGGDLQGSANGVEAASATIRRKPRSHADPDHLGPVVAHSGPIRLVEAH